MSKIRMDIEIRKAKESEIGAVAEIYAMIHEQERQGKMTIGWDPAVYPLRSTAMEAFEKGTLFVMLADERVVASAIINNVQPQAYSLVDWKYPAMDFEVGVIHTLVVNPNYGGCGLGRRFVDFFEDYCRTKGCKVTRLDTQEKNRRPFRLYPRLGYRLAAIHETQFENLPAPVRLAMFEKQL